MAWVNPKDHKEHRHAEARTPNSLKVQATPAESEAEEEPGFHRLFVSGQASNWGPALYKVFPSGANIKASGMLSFLSGLWVISHCSSPV